MSRKRHMKQSGFTRASKIDQSIFNRLKTPEQRDAERKQQAYLAKHPPTRELQAKRSDPKTAVEWLLALPDRMNTMLVASREPDAAKRNRLFKFIASAKMLVVTVVPFVKRPRTFGELVLVQNVTKLIRRMSGKTNNDKP